MVHKKTPNSNAKEPGSSHPSTTPAVTSSPWKSTPATPFTPSSSFEKTVILFDWWLFEAETDVDGKRLAVGGLTMRGQQTQQATRVFNSAPIIKRFDAYTVETADGITVRIQGFINKSRTHHNGVPVEVCNCFLIGFPYNWEVYADEYFGTKPPSTFTSKTAHCVDERPKATSDGSCGIFPIRLDEFPMSKILDVINSSPGTYIDDLLKKSFTSMSKGILDDEQTTNSAEFEIRRLSNDVLPEKNFISFLTTGSKFGGYTLRSRCRTERTQVHSTGVAEGKDLDKKVSNSFSLKKNEQSEAFLESDVRKPQDVSNGKDHGHTVRSKFSSPGTYIDDLLKKSFTSMSKGILDDEQTTNSAEVEIRRLSNDVLPEKNFISFPTTGSKFGGYTLRSRCRTERTQVHSTGVAEGKDLDKKVSNSFSLKKNEPSEAFLESDVRKPQDVSNGKDHGHTVRSKFSSPGTYIDDLLKKSFTSMSKGILDDEQTTNSAEVEIRRLSNDVLPEKNFISFPTTGSKFGGYTLRSRCRTERTQVHSTGVAEGKDLDKKVSNSFSLKKNEPSEAFLESDVRKPQDVSNGKDHGHTVRSKFSSKKDKTALLPSAVSPDEDQYHAEVQRMGLDNKKASNIESSGDPKGPLSNDIDKVCNRIHEKLEKCTFITRKDSNTQVAAVASEKRISEMDEILLKKPLNKSTGSRRKYGAERQKNIQHKTDGIESVMPAHHSDKDTAHSNIPISEHCGTDEASGMIEKDTSEAHTYRKEIQSEDLDGVQQMIKNKASYTRGRTIWKPSYSPVLKTPLTRDMANKSSISSPELLNLGRSRSGRLLVPPIDHWRQEIIYDMDRNMVGITGVDNLNSPMKGSKSLPPSKKRKL